jgi:RimJ/RimL family protein N-acetyltransferase
MKLDQAFLTGERVFLRTLTRADVEGPWLHWFNDQQNTQYMYNGTFPPSADTQMKYLEQVAGSRTHLVLAICLVDDQRHVGNVGLHDIDAFTGRAELGIILGDRSVQRKGIGAEAVRLIVAHGFDRLNLHKVYLRVEEGNTAARACFERAGFRVEGTLREEIRHHGTWRNSIYMGLLESDHRAATQR